MKRSKVLALLLASVMVVSMFAACGGGSGTTTTSTPTSTAKTDDGAAADTKKDEPAPAVEQAPGDTKGLANMPKSDVVKGKTNQQTYPLTTEKKTLTYWYPMGGSMSTLSDFNDAEFFQMYEEKTGVHIDFIVPSTGTEADAFQLLFASDSFPNMLYVTNGNLKYRDGYDACIEDGYVIDITDYYDYVPNYVSWLNSLPDAQKSVFTDTGRMYGLWHFWDSMTENVYNDQGISIRKDFLDKVGMDIPTTYDEWETVLAAFKDQLGIEAPFYTGKYGIDDGEFMAGYGIAPYWYQVDNKVMYGPMQDAYKDYLTMLNKWYVNGWLDNGFATRQSTGIAADNDMILNDKIGALIDWGTRMTDAYLTRGATNPEFYAVAAPQPKKSASDPDPAWRNWGNGYGHCQNTVELVSAELDEATKELALRWLDGWYAEDIYLQANYGLDEQEGVVWYAAEDGHRIGDYDFRYANPDGIDSATVLVKFWTKNPPIRVEACQIEQMPPERSASYDVWSQYYPTNFLPPMTSMTVDEGSEYASTYTDIETYVQEQNVKFIMGQRSLDEYDSYRETLKQMGIERCTELQQAALDRYNAR